MSGWIKLHRKLLDNPIVCKDAEHLALWAYLLLKATHKEMPVFFGGEKIMLQPGQLITGRNVISKELSIDRNKIERVLKSFENEQQIEQQTSNKNRIISILSWSDYQEGEQQDEQQVSNKRATSEQQVSTNKKLRTKEVKKERSKDEKREYADYVFLTETEYGKLTDLLGEDERNNYFLRFASWISGQPKRVQESRSAYLTILNWNRESEKKPQRPYNSNANSNYGKVSVISKLQQLHKEAEERDREASGHY